MNIHAVPSAAVWCLNFLPSQYCDPGWLPPAVRSTAIRYRSDRTWRGHAPLSAWLLDECGAKNTFEFKLNTPTSTLLGLDDEPFRHALRALGLLSIRNQITQIVDARVLKRLAQMARLPNCRGIVDAHGFRLPGEIQLALDQDDARLSNNLKRLGAELLAASLANTGIALTHRLALRLPPQKNAAKSTLISVLTQSSDKALNRWINQTLIKQEPRQWLCV